MTDITLSPMTEAHMPGAHRLSLQAGWPHQPEDWAFVLGISNGVVALEGDRVVGTAMATDFGDWAAVNMIIADEALRGRGLGRKLMEAAMATVGDRPLYLTATVEGQPLYRKLGFVPVGTLQQYQGVMTAVPPVGVPGFRLAGAGDLPTLAAMDRDAMGADRTTALKGLLETGRILLGDRGYAVIRPFGRGKVVGPVVAEDSDTALALIVALAEPGTFLRLDTTPETGLAGMLEASGLSCVDTGTGMVRGPLPPAPARFSRFTVLSQALG